MIEHLFDAKNSKFKQFEIALSRKRAKSNEKVKDSLPKKISIEKWTRKGKKKQHTGPGHYQKNVHQKNVSKNLEHWQRVAIIPWGGEYTNTSGQIIEIINSCTVDPFLQILYMFYVSHIHEMRKLFESDIMIVKKVAEVVQLLLKENFSEAKVYWLTKICSYSPDLTRNVLDAYGTDKNVTLYPIRHIFKRRYEYVCSSENCPSNTLHNDYSSDYVSDMTLHEAKLRSPEDSILINSIKEWELGTSRSAFISCKERFLEESDHDDYISEIYHDEVIIRCSGWRIVSTINFVDSPPCLLFDISSSFREKSFHWTPYPTKYLFTEKYIA